MQASRAAQTATMPANSMANDKVGAEGVAYERVDLSTRCIVHALFPAHTRGFAFFLGLLANATVKQCVLHGMPKDRGDTAIISVQGCAELSRLLHLSYDTTQKYLVIYRALGLLYKEKQGKLTTITIPLAVYHSPGELVKRLRQLRERYLHKRPKLLSLIDNMIERIALLAQEDEERLPLVEQGQTLPNSIEPLVSIQQVLFSEGVEDLDGHIAMRILEVFAHATMAGSSKGFQIASSFDLENLPDQQENVNEVDPAVGESTRRTVPVPSSGSFDLENLPGSRQPDEEEVDSAGVAPVFASADKEVCSRSAAKNLPLCDQDDAKMVDFFQTNVTFNDYHKYISLMVKNVTLREQFQQFVASILEGDARQWRRYNPLLKECSLNNPQEQEAITAALLETLVLHYPNQPLEKPGGYFTKHCRTNRSGVPAYARDLMKMYGHMTYEELVSSLQAGAIQVKVRTFFPLRANLRPGHVPSPYGLFRGHTGTKGSGQSRLEKQGQMSEIEAKSLEVQIRREASFVRVHGIRQVSQSAYVVDVSINGIPWAVASKQDWDRYSDELRTCEARVGQAAN